MVGLYLEKELKDKNDRDKSRVEEVHSVNLVLQQEPAVRYSD